MMMELVKYDAGFASWQERRRAERVARFVSDSFDKLASVLREIWQDFKQVVRAAADVLADLLGERDVSDAERVRRLKFGNNRFIPESAGDMSADGASSFCVSSMRLTAASSSLSLTANI